jgi:hypothetical protein
MVKQVCIIVFFVLTIIYSSEIFSQTNKKIIEMDPIEFIPKEFHNVVLGFTESSENVCTPFFPKYYLKLSNQVAVNIPQKIICNEVGSCPIIPLCGASMIRERQELKYAHLSTPTIHVRKMGEEAWHSGEIVELDSGVNQHPALPPNYYEEEAERQQRIKEAQKYSDDELNEDVGQSSGSAFNVNLVDYITIPFEQGIYEVYVSRCGLESNRVKVEILINK